MGQKNFHLVFEQDRWKFYFAQMLNSVKTASWRTLRYGLYWVVMIMTTKIKKLVKVFLAQILTRLKLRAELATLT